MTINIIEYKDFCSLSDQDQMATLKKLEKNYKAQQIADAWNISRSRVYSKKHYLVKKLSKKEQTKKSKTVKYPKNDKIQKSQDKKKLKDSKINEEATNKEINNIIELEKKEREYQSLKKENHELLLRLKEQEQLFYTTLDKIHQRYEKQHEELIDMRKQEGFHISFKGEMSASEVEKKLEKSILFLEGNARYRIEFTLSEMEQSFINTESQNPEISPTSNSDLKEVEELKNTVTHLKNQMEKTIESKWFEGYTAFKKEEGEEKNHFPESEFENIPQSHNKSIRVENKVTKYQAYYICPCGNKRTVYIPVDAKTVICGGRDGCTKKLAVRDAHKKGFPHQDSFGNYFVAGKFIREDERNPLNSLPTIE